MSSSVARQLPPDTFRLVESNTLVRLPSCVLRSLDASTNALASDSLSAEGPLELIGGFGLPSFGCGHGQRFSTSRRRSSLTQLGHLLGEPEVLVEFFCQRLSSLSLAMPSIQPANNIECSWNVTLQNRVYWSRLSPA